MGGLFGGSKPPEPDNSALEETRKERDELKKKNQAKMANIKGRAAGRSALLAYKPEEAAPLSDTLGG